MKKIFTLFLFTSLCLGLTMTQVSAQSSDKDIMESNLSFHVGCELPLGEISDVDHLNLSNGRKIQLNGAVPGVSLGFQYLYRFEGTSIEGLGHNLFFSADAIWFNSCKEFRDANKAKNDVTSMYFNVPLLVGYNYTHSFTPMFALSAQAGLGADLFFRTKNTTEGDFNYFKMSPAFAAGAQLSFIIANQFSFDFRYAFLGNQYIRVKGLADYGDNPNSGNTGNTGNNSNTGGFGNDDHNSNTHQTKPFQYRGSVSTFSIRFGYHF